MNVTKSALAKELGIAPPTVSRYVNMGMPTSADGTCDPAICRSWIADHIRALVRGPHVKRSGRATGTRGSTTIQCASMRD
jgi:predicted transcriptional regulator